jgi:hypothetical protein
VKNITFIKGYQKAYPEVIPHRHLGIPIGTVKNKSIVSPRPHRSLPTTVVGDIARIVQMHEVALNSIWLPLTSDIMEIRVLPSAAGQAKLLASSMVQRYKMSQNIL